MMSATQLQLHCSEREGATILQIGGALRESNASTLERRSALLLTRLRHPLIIDLSQVHACDSAGAAVLVGISRAASPATPVRLAGLTDAVQQLLRAAGVLRSVPTFTTVGGAVRADPTDLLNPPD